MGGRFFTRAKRTAMPLRLEASGRLCRAQEDSWLAGWGPDDLPPPSDTEDMDMPLPGPEDLDCARPGVPDLPVPVTLHAGLCMS